VIKKANFRSRKLKNLPNFAAVHFSLLLKLHVKGTDKQLFTFLTGEELKILVRGV